ARRAPRPGARPTGTCGENAPPMRPPMTEPPIAPMLTAVPVNTPWAVAWTLRGTAPATHVTVPTEKNAHATPPSGETATSAHGEETRATAAARRPNAIEATMGSRSAPQRRTRLADPNQHG